MTISTKLGLPVDNLIGLVPSAADPYSQPLHLRADSHSSSVSSSPSLLPVNSHSVQPHNASARVPIPRPPSQIRRPHPNMNAPPSASTTPPSSASASLSSPSPFSPTNGTGISATTTFTTPPSSESPRVVAFGTTVNPHELTYPSVPPPSLSSSFGEPISPLDMPRVQTATTAQPIPLPRPIPRRYPRNSEDFDLSISPSDIFGYGRGGLSSSPRSPLSPRASFHLARRASYERVSGGQSSADASPMDGFSRNHSRMASLERGARVAETGRLVPRNRAGSTAGSAGPSEPKTNGHNEQGPT